MESNQQNSIQHETEFLENSKNFSSKERNKTAIITLMQEKNYIGSSQQHIDQSIETGETKNEGFIWNENDAIREPRSYKNIQHFCEEFQCYYPESVEGEKIDVFCRNIAQNLFPGVDLSSVAFVVQDNPSDLGAFCYNRALKDGTTVVALSKGMFGAIYGANKDQYIPEEVFAFILGHELTHYGYDKKYQDHKNTVIEEWNADLNSLWRMHEAKSPKYNVDLAYQFFKQYFREQSTFKNKLMRNLLQSIDVHGKPSQRVGNMATLLTYINNEAGGVKDNIPENNISTYSKILFETDSFTSHLQDTLNLESFISSGFTKQIQLLQTHINSVDNFSEYDKQYLSYVIGHMSANSAKELQQVAQMISQSVVDAPILKKGYVELYTSFLIKKFDSIDQLLSITFTKLPDRFFVSRKTIEIDQELIKISKKTDEMTLDSPLNILVTGLLKKCKDKNLYMSENQYKRSRPDIMTSDYATYFYDIDIYFRKSYIQAFLGTAPTSEKMQTYLLGQLKTLPDRYDVIKTDFADMFHLIGALNLKELSREKLRQLTIDIQKIGGDTQRINAHISKQLSLQLNKKVPAGILGDLSLQLDKFCDESDSYKIAEHAEQIVELITKQKIDSIYFSDLDRIRFPKSKINTHIECALEEVNEDKTANIFRVLLYLGVHDTRIRDHVDPLFIYNSYNGYVAFSRMTGDNQLEKSDRHIFKSGNKELLRPRYLYNHGIKLKDNAMHFHFATFFKKNGFPTRKKLSTSKMNYNKKGFKEIYEKSEIAMHGRYSRNYNDSINDADFSSVAFAFINGLIRLSDKELISYAKLFCDTKSNAYHEKICFYISKSFHYSKDEHHRNNIRYIYDQLILRITHLKYNSHLVRLFSDIIIGTAKRIGDISDYINAKDKSNILNTPQENTPHKVFNKSLDARALQFCINAYGGNIKDINFFQDKVQSISVSDISFTIASTYTLKNVLNNPNIKFTSFYECTKFLQSYNSSTVKKYIGPAVTKAFSGLKFSHSHSYDNLINIFSTINQNNWHNHASKRLSSLGRTIAKKIEIEKNIDIAISKCTDVLSESQINDYNLRMRFIILLKDLLVKKYGKDDGSYLEMFKQDLQIINNKISLSLMYNVMELFSNDVFSQKELSQYIGNLLESQRIGTKESETMSERTSIWQVGLTTLERRGYHDNIIEYFVTNNKIIKNLIIRDLTILFAGNLENNFVGDSNLNQEMTIDKLRQGNLKGLDGAVIKKYYENKKVVEDVYKNFRGLPMEGRTMVLNNMYHNSEDSLKSDYRHTPFNFLINKLFPKKGEFMQETRIILEEYVSKLEEYERMIFLSALMTSAEKVEGQSFEAGEVLASILEMLGPAEIKLGQALHSHPGVPENISKHLKRLKSKAKVPPRWEVFKTIDSVIPSSLRDKIGYVGNIFRASIDTGIEIEEEDGDQKFLTIQTEHAQQKINNGLNKLKKVVKAIQNRDDDVFDASFISTMYEILDKTEKNIRGEVDEDTIIEKEKIADELYEGLQININDITYNFTSAKILTYGKRYKCAQRMQGPHFNDIASASEKKQAGVSILTTELLLNFMGLRTDTDRHGDNVRVDRVNDTSRRVGMFDFGGISLESMTSRKKELFVQMIYQVFQTVTNNAGDIMTTFVRYVNNFEGSKEDTAYVYSIQQRILSLGDYIKVVGSTEILGILVGIAKSGMVDEEITELLQEKGIDLSTFELMSSPVEITKNNAEGFSLPKKIEREKSQVASGSILTGEKFMKDE